MKIIVLASCALTVFLGTAFSQQSSVQPIQLEIKGKTKVDLEPTLFYGNGSCDKKGNLYAGKYSATGESPLVRVTPEGKVATKFLPADHESPGRFFVSRDGEVYEVYEDTKRNTMIARYDEAGRVSSNTRLDGNFKVGGTFAVFKSGEILIAMFDGSSEGLWKPFTGVFSQGGKLLKRIDLEDDERVTAAAKLNDQSLVRRAPNSTSNEAVLNSAIVMASDGNAYLMRKTTPALIFVISAGGEVTRKLSVDAEAPNLFPFELFEAQGMIAVVFAGSQQPHEPSSRIHFVDRQTGEIVRTFDLNREVAGLVACIDDNGGVTSLGVENRKPVLHQLGPQ